jgi:ribosome-binding ATPase
MKIGIVGLPNVGKSTLFKALTKNPVDISNYPFCTIEPNVGVVRVPDERLDKLAEMSKSKKIVPTVIEFVDIAGLVRGASEGEGLGNKFLANIREVDAIAQVVRVFQNEKITHVYDKIDPENDIEIINTELILADLETIKKTEVRLEKDMRGNIKGAKEKLEIVKEIKKLLEAGKLASEFHLEAELLGQETVKNIIREMSLLTVKPFIYVYNVSENEKLKVGSEKVDKIIGKNNTVNLDIKIEEELGEMSQEEARELGMKSNLDQLVVKAYQILGLITFLTTGEDETRAWTVKYGSTAPQAGAAIHTDFQQKFIRADIIHWEKLLEAGSWSKARDLGWLRTEGKEYVVVDGDVIEFKI